MANTPIVIAHDGNSDFMGVLETRLLFAHGIPRDSFSDRKIEIEEGGILRDLESLPEACFKRADKVMRSSSAEIVITVQVGVMRAKQYLSFETFANEVSKTLELGPYRLQACVLAAKRSNGHICYVGTEVINLPENVFSKITPTTTYQELFEICEGDPFKIYGHPSNFGNLVADAFDTITESGFEL